MQPSELDELCSREAIRDCLFRYARGLIVQMKRRSCQPIGLMPMTVTEHMPDLLPGLSIECGLFGRRVRAIFTILRIY